MRLTPIKPDGLDALQHSLYVHIYKGIDENFKGFVAKREDGALLGPFNPMVHFPQFGSALWAYNIALSTNSTLPKIVREVAILVVGARFTARYEIYAHEKIARLLGMSEHKIAAINAGQRPDDLTEEESLAHDVASVLTKGAQLPESLYGLAKNKFGDNGLAELIHLIGCYCLISVLLNAYDIPVPNED
ncbi:carboxymuconolactone decarboxylase family protein [Mucilaginibacter lappiensis]|uniref:carboxymuconolactone decarboxylase family protein n=1 Tax=Mucilaginibacter lappiensis TaxID=354630 RepID=UPI003D1E901D